MREMRLITMEFPKMGILFFVRLLQTSRLSAKGEHLLQKQSLFDSGLARSIKVLDLVIDYFDQSGFIFVIDYFDQ